MFFFVLAAVSDCFQKPSEFFDLLSYCTKGEDKGKNQLAKHLLIFY